MSRRTIFLFLWLAVFLGIVFLILKISKGIKREKKLAVAVDKITKIEISKGERKISLLKEDNVWKVLNYPCDINLINTLLSEINKTVLTDLVSSEQESFEEFEVDEATNGIIVKLYEGDVQKLGFVLGKSGFDYTHYYFRFLGKNETYLSKGLDRTAIDKDIDDWRNKVILSIDKVAVEEVELKYPKESFNIFQKDMKWYDTSGKELDESKVSSFLIRLLELRADGFVYEDIKFEKVDLTISIKSKVGNYEIFLKERRKDKEITEYLVMKKDDPTIYKIEKYKYEDLKKKLSDFSKSGTPS